MSILLKKRKLGQLVMAGFEGTKVTDNVRTLIESYHVSTIILSSKNFESVQQTKSLIYELQQIARAAGYEYPIMFAIDQEGGMVSSLFDENYITQFPGLMGLALSASPELIYDVCKAMGTELKSIGFSINLGPVLDIVTKFSHQLIGVRSFGSTVEEVIKYGSLLLRGFKDAGLFTFGKHFPGLNNAEVSSSLELPMLTETLEQVENSNVLTFKALIDLGLLDGLEASGALVPNISPDEFHACLSTVLIDDLLRQKLKFDGVVVSECLEMEALFCNIGFKQGVIMAMFARCDLILVCHDFALQVELVNALLQAIDDGVLDEALIIDESLRRIRNLQMKLPSWDEIFNLEGITESVMHQHQELSKLAYRKSITLVRDYHSCLPITKFFRGEDLVPENNGLLLLTPIITPLYSKNNGHHSHHRHFPGEEVFQEFGKMLSSYKTEKENFKVYHTSYTANGLTNLHEELIERCKAVILITSETTRNLHQIGIAKHISILCGGSNHKAPTRKPLVIVAVSSPFDFYYNKNIGSTYLCTYDYTDNALENLAKVLMGEYKPIGTIPGEHPKRAIDEADSTRKKRKKDAPQRRWLVDTFDLQRDWKSLVSLTSTTILLNGRASIENIHAQQSITPLELIERPEEERNFKRFLAKFFQLLHDNSKTQKHFVVRNSSLNTLYGFISTWYSERLKTGSILYMMVDPSKRNQAIGKSLHSKATKYLIDERKCERITLGSPFPLMLFPSKRFFSLLQKSEEADDDLDNLMSNSPLYSFLTEDQKWTFDKFRKSHTGLSQLNYVLKLENLKNWSVSKKLVRQLQVVGIMFDICQNLDEVLQLILTHHPSNPALYELYAEAARCGTAEVKVLVALEPTNKSVVGSIVVFTNDSSLSKFYPFMEYFDSNMGGLTGLMIDPSYENLTDVFKLGLVCTSLTYLRKQDENLNGCVLIGISKANNNINNFKDNGFTIYKQYYDYYDEKDKWL